MFSNNLKKLRTARGITQEELADIVGKSQQAVNLWERGTNEPGIESLNKLADHFGVTVDYLLGRQTEAVEEEGFLLGLNPEAKKRVKQYANYERIYQNLPESKRTDSSGLTNTDKNGKKPKLKRGIRGKERINRRASSEHLNNKE